MKTLLAIAMLLPLSALAADPAKVSVQAEVVHTKITGDKVEPASLKTMQTALSKKVHYGTLVRLSTQKLELTSTPTAIKLPNNKEAMVSVDGLADDVATLKVKLPPADATYKLGRSGSLYLQGGTHEGGELWLVLSPAR